MGASHYSIELVHFAELNDAIEVILSEFPKIMNDPMS